MLVTDFEFAGQKASSWGLMPCSFDNTDSDTLSNGSKLTFSTAKPAKGDIWHYAGSQYNEQLTGTLEVTKKNCSGSYADNFFSLEELRAIMRWLNRKDGYHRLVLTIDDMPGYEEIWFNAYINVSVVEQAGLVVGLSLEITTDKPYGYFAERVAHMELSGTTNLSGTILDMSDEIGISYPKFIFDVQPVSMEHGVHNFLLTHSWYDNNYTLVSKNTIIRFSDMTEDDFSDYIWHGENDHFSFVIDSKNRMIYVNDDEQMPLDPRYFNFEWPTLVNTADSNLNTFTVGGNLANYWDVSVVLTPVAKVGLI